jgi:hypothetical protein
MVIVAGGPKAQSGDTVMTASGGASNAHTPTSAEWLVRVDGALQAHFKQDEGPSKPGTDYKIGLKHGADDYQIFVRAYLSPDLSAAARADSDYQARTVIGYVFDRLSRGWTPSLGPLPALTIVNATPDGTRGPSK